MKGRHLLPSKEMVEQGRASKPTVETVDESNDDDGKTKDRLLKGTKTTGLFDTAHAKADFPLTPSFFLST